MNANAKKWVNALRSGKYMQGAGSLRWGELYCCLGVACELAVENGVEIEVEIEVVEDDRGIYRYGESDALLPREVMEWLRLSSSNGAFEDGDVLTSLSEINDDGETFFEIADIIESEPAGLFA